MARALPCSNLTKDDEGQGRMTVMDRGGKRRLRQRGIALVMVLWILVLLSLIAAAFLSETRTEAVATHNRVAAAESEALAEAAVNWAIWRLIQESPGGSLTDRDAEQRLPADGRLVRWRHGGGVVLLSVRDEAGKLDINTTRPEILGRLLYAMGVERDRSRVLAARIADFRDIDDVARAEGAEATEYRAAGLDYGPKNAPFEAVDELGQVLGLSSDLAERLRPHTTVATGAGTVDPEFASVEALAALPQLEFDTAVNFVRERSASPPGMGPSAPSGSTFAVSPRTAYTITAEAHGPNGGIFVREAMVRLQRRDPVKPYDIWVWRQSPRRLSDGGEVSSP